MKQKIAIYLAGSIQKGHEKADESFWTEDNMRCLRTCLPNYTLSFLNPAFRADSLTDQLSVFGRDMLQVFSSDLVFVDVRDRRGLGVGAEMMWAKVNRIPVICWAPEDTHYNKRHTTVLGVSVPKYIHPFVESLSDKIVGTLEEGANWIHQLLSNPMMEIKGVEQMEKAMEYYKAKQLHQDAPMQELLNAHDALRKRVEHLTALVQA